MKLERAIWEPSLIRVTMTEEVYSGEMTLFLCLSDGQTLTKFKAFCFMYELACFLGWKKCYAQLLRPHNSRKHAKAWNLR